MANEERIAGLVRSELERRVCWIPTEYELPKPHTPVLVARVYEAGRPLKVEQGMLTEGGWWKVYGTNVRRVGYWMPMPEPPEAEP